MGSRTPSRPLGLTAAQASLRLVSQGPNRLPAAPRAHPLRILAAQMVHFFALMLWAAAALSVVAGMPALAVAIAVVVVLNGVFAFAQEYRADKAADRLRDLMPSRATVRRDGRTQLVDSADLVVGDVVQLEAGDRISADLLLLRDSAVQIDESALTGESTPVPAAVGDPAFAGTYVVQGIAAGEVTATANHTRLAGIAAVTQAAVRPRSPLAAQLDRVVRIIAATAVAVGAGFFGVALLLGRESGDSFLFAIGVTVALVPEGLLPTVTLSLARAAQRMAHRHALVRRLEAVETLGAATYICTDKTGTLTRNEMSVVEFWSPAGVARIDGAGYAPSARVDADPAALSALTIGADSAARCVPDAHAVADQGGWRPVGDPMEVALRVAAQRVGVQGGPVATARFPFDAMRRRSSAVDGDGVHVIGAPDSVLPQCLTVPAGVDRQVIEMAERGLRVLAVASKPHVADLEVASVESGLRLLGVFGLQDPPRPDVGAAIARCRDAGIRLAMVTGDHPRTAAAIAREVGLMGAGGLVVEGGDLPPDADALGAMLDRDEVVVARVTPQDKLRIAAALQRRGHVVAMTGDGVNDGPALRAADIGIAMGASGTDVAREAADLVLLDDHFGSIVGAIELGRSTSANIRRFLTYHLTDNVAELTPFVVWALSGGRVPLALTVLQVLALDIGTDLLPALALGAERPNPRTMEGSRPQRGLLDGAVLRRAFGVLGPTEALGSMTAFIVVLAMGGWRFGDVPPAALLAVASGSAFAAVVLGQLANVFACRSETRWVGRTGVRGNPLLLVAVAVELVALLAFLLLDPLPDVLGGRFPSGLGWALALLNVPLVLAADTVHKRLRHKRLRHKRLRHKRLRHKRLRHKRLRLARRGTGPNPLSPSGQRREGSSRTAAAVPESGAREQGSI